MHDLEDKTAATELLELAEDIEALELRLQKMTSRRDDLITQVGDQLKAIGLRSTRIDGILLTISREPRWQTSVANGVKWALKHEHHGVLTVKQRDFSRKVQQFVDQGHKPDDWIKRFDILKLTIKR